MIGDPDIQAYRARKAREFYARKQAEEQSDAERQLAECRAALAERDWISVEEQPMPADELVAVIVQSKDSLNQWRTVAYQDSGLNIVGFQLGWFRRLLLGDNLCGLGTYSTDPRYVRVTHWRPLPEPPATE